jgi:hypothetical protein
MLNWLIKLFANPLVQSVAATLVGKLAAGLSDVAGSVVKNLFAEDTLTNEQKRSQAFKRIRNRAKAEGLEFSDAAINLAIEAAVAGLKDQLKK